MKTQPRVPEIYTLIAIVLLLVAGISPVLADGAEQMSPMDPALDGTISLAAGPDAITLMSAMQDLPVQQYDAQHIFTVVDNGKTVEINEKDRCLVALYSSTATETFRPWRMDSSGGLDLQAKPPMKVKNYEGDTSLWLFEANTPGTYTLTFNRYTPESPSVPSFQYRLTVVVKSHWHVTTVDDTSKNNRVRGDGMYSSMVFGRDGMPHISYYSPGWGAVRYTDRTGDTWNPVTVAGSRDTFRTSIDLSPEGNPAFTFSDSDANIGDLNYAWWDGAKWSTEHINTPVSGGDCRRIGMWNSFRFSPDGTPHVAYGSAIKNVHLVYASRLNGNWNTREEVDTDDAGYEPSLAFNASGSPFIAYRSMAYAPSLARWVGSLRFAERGADGIWKVTTVDDAQNWGDTGYNPSLALDSAGNPHISYVNVNPHDGSNNGIRYASRSASGKWSIETVARGDTDTWGTQVLDSSDKVYIAYHSGGELKVALRNATSKKWDFEIVDRGSVGRCTSIALTPGGNPAISYYDYGNLALKYAESTG